MENRAGWGSIYTIYPVIHVIFKDLYNILFYFLFSICDLLFGINEALCCKCVSIDSSHYFFSEQRI